MCLRPTVSSRGDAGEWFGVATTVLLGVAFLNSSIRLTALRRSPQV